MTMQTQPNSGHEGTRTREFLVNPYNLTEGVNIGSETPLEKAVKIKLEELSLPSEGRVECELIAPIQGNYRCELIEENCPLVVEVAQGSHVPLRLVREEK